ncbi:MAG: polyphosphate kinase 2 family protein [Anaerolineaceae bacterium]|nr:polyphosphate kinase 2 family protein [Anaerolineaceae bacterium]
MHVYQVKENKNISLNKYDPNDTKLWKSDKKGAKKAMKDLRKELIKLQQLLYAEHKHKILIVLQAMDSGGKDGTIRSIFKGVNPQGVHVASFKVPTPEEIGHDYLWRIHKQTPKNGEIVIFNRSHYEDVLVVRVHQLVSEKVWEKRYEHIRNFERTLTEEGTIILKFFLHISKDEQKKRFIERIENPEKQWKFKIKDIDERKLWDDYMQAYEDALVKTSTKYAPWYVIPANRNWYRDFVIIKIITETMNELKMSYPEPIENIKQYKSLIN